MLPDSVIQDIGAIASTVTGVMGMILAIRQSLLSKSPSPSPLKNTSLL